MYLTETTKQNFCEILKLKLPEQAVQYACDLWLAEPFAFKITTTRSTCLGNYSFRKGRHKITVNEDLNSYQFLITYMHEVAHQRVFIKYMQARRKRVLPHGKEWKVEFRELMQPLLTDSVFPNELLKILIVHLKNPSASTVRDINLLRMLQTFDEKKVINENDTRLEELQEGESFVFSRRKFVKLQTRRTRVLCLEEESKRKFTIPKMALVRRV